MKDIKIKGPEKLPQVRWFSYGYGYSVDTTVIGILTSPKTSREN